MYVELLQGRAGDRAKLEDAWKYTLAKLAETADRWISATAGAASDGSFQALLGFESEEGAFVTADRLQANGTWDRLGRTVQELRFSDCPRVRTFGGEDLDDTAVMQVRQGKVLQVDRLIATFEEAGRSGSRRDRAGAALGGLLCWDETGTATSALYLGSREGPGLDRFRRDTALLLDKPLERELQPLRPIVSWLRSAGVRASPTGDASDTPGLAPS
jgi:hypothetical protein